MGVTRGTPWWLGWLLVAGLASVFTGERILASLALPRAVFSGLGALLVLGGTAWRLAAWRAASGQARRVEAVLLLAHVGCLLALLGHLASSQDGMRWLGLDFADAEAGLRYREFVQVLWTTVLAVSLLPILGAQLALGAHRHARGDAVRVEAVRVVGTASGALAVALAGAFLLLTGYVASARDKTVDLSYFKTASPGEATAGMVSSLPQPLTVLLFFPEVNPVKDEVQRYFRGLADATGAVAIEEYDRLTNPRLAEEHRVVDDGIVVLQSGGQSEQLAVGPTMEGSRAYLRTLDRNVQQAVLKLLRGPRVVYLTTGHGELNDPASGGPMEDAALVRVDAFREMLRFLNYEVAELGIASGLASEVPSDADMVMVLGPRRAFLPEEAAALDRYFAGGGSLLFAMDPSSDFSLEPFEASLGVRFVPVPLADDEQYLSQRGDLSDRRLIVTDRFSAHETVTTLTRAGAGAGIFLVGPGYLEPVEGAAVEPLFVVHSLSSTFADLDGDYQFDEGSEVRRPYSLVAAVERDAPPGDSAAVARSPRALVYAGSATFSDAVLLGLGLNAALVADGVKWLGREEAFAGATESEEDVAIQHTRAEDVAWFYATILGAPTLLLVAGLVGIHRRRHRRSHPRRETA